MDDQPAPCCFDGWAHRAARRARDRDVADAISFVMLADLARVGLSGRTVLDVGCGTGDLTLATLARGATRATGIDLGHGAIEDAQGLAEARGLSDRATFVVGDGASADLPDADVVVLHRVVCCYPHVQGLLDNTLRSARTVYALSVPVDRGPVGTLLRATARLGNLWFAARPRRYRWYRAYVHPMAGIDARIKEEGFRPVLLERRRVTWNVAVYERSSDPPKAGRFAQVRE